MVSEAVIPVAEAPVLESPDARVPLVRSAHRGCPAKMAFPALRAPSDPLDPLDPPDAKGRPGPSD